VCERRFAVCYTLPPIRTDFEAAQNSKQLSAVHVLEHCLSTSGSQLFMSSNASEMLGLQNRLNLSLVAGFHN
jgi:hypothetical protein